MLFTVPVVKVLYDLFGLDGRHSHRHHDSPCGALAGLNIVPGVEGDTLIQLKVGPVKADTLLLD